MPLPDFSYATRLQSLETLKSQEFDFLLIGGGITGAGVAREAVYRGYSVALVEQRDFASGTSSASSKLIHGGLRYLENLELGLVFEALSERTLLLETVPTMVRPLPFYLPVYQGDARGMSIVSFGLWLYDLLSVFRTPEMHRRYSRERLLREIPFLKPEGLKGGFRYYDASMWDDVLVIETLRDAWAKGVAGNVPMGVANYTECVSPIWDEDVGAGGGGEGRIIGAQVRDAETGEVFSVRARKVIVCGGPWTDVLGERFVRKGGVGGVGTGAGSGVGSVLSDTATGKGNETWHPWLAPSKGVHLIFDLKRIPVPGAIVMSHPEDGRISFVIPRPDYGAGVTIVGTTDGPTGADPGHLHIEKGEVLYLMRLLNQYFPDLNLSPNDILSAYVGVRPLFGGENAGELQKVSREHHIATGPGGTVFVAGGKYTTYRRMAKEIVDFTMSHWGDRELLKPKKAIENTKLPLNTNTVTSVVEEAKTKAQIEGIDLEPELIERFGASALEIVHLEKTYPPTVKSPEGFPRLEAQFRFSVRTEMVLHVQDFYFRRLPLFRALRDHGVPYVNRLAEILAEEMGIADVDKGRWIKTEVDQVLTTIDENEAWRKSL